MDESNLQRLQDERDQLKRSSKEASQVLKLEAAGNRSTASADVVRSSRRGPCWPGRQSVGAGSYTGRLSYAAREHQERAAPAPVTSAS